MKKRIFIASSVEGLDVAYAAQENLEYNFEVTVWPQGIFKLTRSTLDSLYDSLRKFDAAIFVFTPDDEVIIRDKKESKVRDNVLFELGLFLGGLGRECCFILQPRSANELSLPKDLLGVTPATYDDKREDGNLVAALGPPCNKIRRAIIPHSRKEPPRVSSDATLEDILLSRPFRLFFNPENKRSKKMVFKGGGLITEGNNQNEHSWRVVKDRLELVNLAGKVFSRFYYDKKDKMFKHTNEEDTLSLRGQYIVPEE
jgi:hypothetical protein